MSYFCHECNTWKEITEFEIDEQGKVIQPCRGCKGRMNGAE